MNEANGTGATIWISANGPYLVSGGVPLTSRKPVANAAGEWVDWAPSGAFDVGEKYALCRCGHSRNKPFCDGTHKTLGFDGAFAAPSEGGAARRESYEGPGVVMTDDRSLCAHYGFCGNRETSAWDLVAEAGDPGSLGLLQRMVGHCPSGRLELVANGRRLEPAFEPSVATIPNGPLWVRGGIPLQTADGVEWEVLNRMLLCRCGASRNKPFCDGSHRKAGFRAP